MGTMHRPKASDDKPLHFYSSVCQYCFDVGSKVKVCSSCGVMPYCSRKHQALDWPFHKVLCKAIKTSNRKLPYAVSDGPALINYRTVLQVAWECSLGRRLTGYESSVLMHMPYCNVCFERRNLVHCDGCRCVSYCSEGHRKSDEAHSDSCKLLELGLKLDDEALGSSPPFGPFRLFQVMPRNIDELVKGARQNDNISTYFYSHLLSCIGTLIYLLQNVPSRQTVDLHVIGASSHEDVVDWTYCGELLQQLFKIDSNISLIGPEVNTAISNRTADSVAVSRYKGLYHEVAKSLPIPTCVVVFNAGIRAYAGEESDTWRETIPWLLRENVPLLVTGYTEEEARKDENCMLGHERVRSIVGCTENPFRSRKPIRNPIMVGERPFFSNYYVFICRRDT